MKEEIKSKSTPQIKKESDLLLLLKAQEKNNQLLEQIIELTHQQTLILQTINLIQSKPNQTHQWSLKEQHKEAFKEIILRPLLFDNFWKKRLFENFNLTETNFENRFNELTNEDYRHLFYSYAKKEKKSSQWKEYYSKFWFNLEPIVNNYQNKEFQAV